MEGQIAQQTSSRSICRKDGEERNRQSRAVITEEEYTSTLSTIISRDYYPALPSLRRDAAIMKLRAEGDISGAVAIRRAARKLAMHEEALAEQEIEDEMEAVLLHGGIRKQARPLERETVEGFHARVTSEDNAEFESVMTREKLEKRERIAIIYNSLGSEAKDVTLSLANGGSCNDEHTQHRSGGGNLNETPLMASDQFNQQVERTHAPGTTKDGKNISNYNSLFFTPQHYPSLQTKIIPNASNNTILRQSIDNKSFDGMPPPAPMNNADQIEQTVVASKGASQTKEQRDMEPLHEIIRRGPSNHMQLVEYTAKATSHSCKKRIVALNTRLPYQNESRLITSSNHEIALSADNNRIKPTYETDATTDLDASPRPLGAERLARTNLLKSKKYDYVPMTPLIIPVQGAGYPNPGCQPFTLPNEDGTENVARAASQNLADKSRRCKEDGGKAIHRQVSTSSRDKKRKDILQSRNPAKSSLLERTNSLTPAAKSLLQKFTNNSMVRLASSTRKMPSNVSARSKSALGSALRTSYTPKTSRSRSKLRSSTKRKCTEQKATPLLSPKRTNIGSSVMLGNHGTEARGSRGGDNCNDLTGGLLKF